MERMRRNAIIERFFALLVSGMKAELKWIDVYMIMIKFLALSRICQSFNFKAALVNQS
jgi:hypothetical protein